MNAGTIRFENGGIVAEVQENVNVRGPYDELPIQNLPAVALRHFQKKQCPCTIKPFFRYFRYIQ